MATASKAKSKHKTETRTRVKFSATNIFAGDNRANLSSSLPIAPGVDAESATKLPGTVLTLLQNYCQYECFEMAGSHVTGSVVTGTITRYPAGNLTAVGYEWGVLENGEHWLAQVEEQRDPEGATTGTWKLRFGTGSLAGIEGEATYENHPQQGATVVRSSLTGWYSLPVNESEPAE